MTMVDQLLDAIGDVGMDLIDTAEKARFPKSFLRRALPVAACMALLLGAGLYVQSWMSADGTQPAALPQPAAQTDEIMPDLETVDYYILELPGETRRVAAVDGVGNILAEAENMELIIDQATDTPLAFLATTAYGVDSAQSTAERIIYDLEGREWMRLNARQIQVLGDVAAVEFASGEFGLYRLDGTPVRSGFTDIVVMPDCIIAQTEGPLWEIYGPNGQMQMTLEVTLRYNHWKGKTSFAKQSEDGLWGVADACGNWLLEPAECEIRSIHNGCVYYSKQGTTWLVDLETGRTVSGADMEPYGDYLIWCHSEGKEQAFRLTDWLGRELISSAQWIQRIDEEADGIPELFLAKQGSAVICVEPDGTERLRIEEAGTIQAVSSEAAVYTKTIQDQTTGQWIVDFALIDLTTGVGRRSFDKDYISASVLRTYNAAGYAQLTGYFLADYKDSGGNLCSDLLDAAGNVMIENVSGWDSEYRLGDAFYTENGYRLLDGSWLYRFE